MSRSRDPGSQARRGLLLPAPRLPRPLAVLGAIVDSIVVAIGGVMIAIVFANVVLHLFGRDNPWTIELSEFLMVWVTFLGGASAARRNAHMTITELVDKLEPQARRGMDFAIQSLAAIVLCLLGWFGMGIVNAGWGNELTVLRIPMALQYLALPVGSAAMLAFIAWDMAQIVRGVPRDVRYAMEGDAPAPGPLPQAAETVWSGSGAASSSAAAPDSLAPARAAAARGPGSAWSHPPPDGAPPASERPGERAPDRARGATSERQREQASASPRRESAPVSQPPDGTRGPAARGDALPPPLDDVVPPVSPRPRGKGKG